MPPTGRASWHRRPQTTDCAQMPCQNTTLRHEVGPFAAGACYNRSCAPLNRFGEPSYCHELPLGRCESYAVKVALVLYACERKVSPRGAGCMLGQRCLIGYPDRRRTPLETAHNNRQRNMPAVPKSGSSPDASCAAKIQGSFSWRPRRNMTLFIYDHRRLRSVVASVLGTSALQWYDGIYSPSARDPMKSTVLHGSSDEFEYLDAFLVSDIPRVIASQWPEFRLVDDSREADAVLWLVWDFAFCVASGVSPLMWEHGKRRLTASCPAHVKLLSWLQQTQRWKTKGGRDHVFIVGFPSDWQELDSRQSKFRYRLAHNRWNRSWSPPVRWSADWWSSWGARLVHLFDFESRRNDAAFRDVHSAAEVLRRLTTSSVIIAVEDSRLPMTQGASRMVVAPHNVAPIKRFAGRRPARNRFASFVGSVRVAHNMDCPACLQRGIRAMHIRQKVVHELHHQCTGVSGFGASGCTVIDLDDFREMNLRNNLSAIHSKGINLREGLHRSMSAQASLNLSKLQPMTHICGCARCPPVSALRRAAIRRQ